MSDTCPLGFEAFLTRHTSDFARIARASRGEWQADDVRGEAWTLAFDLGRKRGRPFDLGRPDDASLLVRCLHNHCVKYGETVVRYATRLDHASSGDDPNALRPWRAFKLPPSRSSASPRQMGLDYRARPRQPARGQLWLL